MNKPITLVIFEDPDKWLRENLQYMSLDNIASCFPDEYLTIGKSTRYYDKEEDCTKICTWEDHITALRLLTEQIGRTLFVGGISNPFQLLSVDNWDIEVWDVYCQLVYRQEVIYG